MAFQASAAAVDECRAQLAAAQCCYRKKLDKLNARLSLQAAERQLLDERREACFEQLQQESCLVRSQLQAWARIIQLPSSTIIHRVQKKVPLYFCI